MKIKLLNKKHTEKNKEIKQTESTLLNVKKNIFQIPVFQEYNALMKLRIVVSLVFLFITIPIMLLIFAGNNSGMWQISAILFLLGYIMLFILLFKLFRVQKL